MEDIGAFYFFYTFDLSMTYYLVTGVFCYSYACRDCCDLVFVSQTQQAQSDIVNYCQALPAFRIWWTHPNSLWGTSVSMQIPKLRISPILLIISGQNHVGLQFKTF